MNSQSHALHPTAIVIFGGTGDLASTKLFPALLDLYVAGQLPERFVIIGLSRKQLSHAEYQAFVRESVADTGHAHDANVLQDFCSHLRYVPGSFADLEAYERVKEALQEYDNSIGQCTNKLFYLAVPPQYYEVIFDHLATSEALALCDHKEAWARLLVEKPFGHDLTTAQSLEKKLCSLFADEQIYRIDHYLAKDAIENIMALRFANTVLTNSWDGRTIESIHIRLLETKDVLNRGSFYDAMGTLRDVGQNHLLQIFALLTMPSVDMQNAHSIRAARTKALSKLQNSTVHTMVRAQYDGYTDTTGVEADSTTETYFKLEFTLSDETWQNTKFILEAGKALDRHVNEAIVTFASQNNTDTYATHALSAQRNTLTMQFAPRQHIDLSMWTKQPGFSYTLQEQVLTLVEDAGEDCASPEAYERVLFDCIAGDQTRFVSGDEVELAWRFITPILEQFNDVSLTTYVSGSVGPDGST